MYYKEEEIDENLRCPKCKCKYIEPKFLPCGNSMCQVCIEELKESSQTSTIKCAVCGQDHGVPSEGFASNKFIEKLLSVQPSQVYRGESFEQFRSVLGSMRTKLDELRAADENPCECIETKCASIRNEIDIAAETLHVQVNDLRDKYMSVLATYEFECRKRCKETCLGKSKKERDDELGLMSNADEFEKTGLEMLKRDDLREDTINEALECGDGYLASILDRLANLVGLSLMKEKRPMFVTNSLKFKSSTFIDDLKLAYGDYQHKVEQAATSNLRVVDLRDLLGDQVVDTAKNEKTTLTEFGGGFVACSYQEGWFQVDLIETNTKPTVQIRSLLKAHTNVGHHSACANDAYFYVLYSNPKSTKTSRLCRFAVDSNSNNDATATATATATASASASALASTLADATKQVQIDYGLIAIAANNTNVYALGKNKFYKYDLDLELIETKETNKKSLYGGKMLHMPKWNDQIVMKVDDTGVLYFHNGAQLTAFDLFTGSVNFTYDKSVSRHFTLANNSIVSLDAANKKLDLYDKDGCFIFSKQGIIGIEDADWKNLRFVDVSCYSYDIWLFDSLKHVMYMIPLE